MSDFIGIAVVGDRQVELQFETFPEIARDRLRGRLERIVSRLTGEVRALEPSRTGKLRSDTGGRVYEHQDRIAAVVGVQVDSGMGKSKRGSSAVGKAAALEYGSTGRPFDVTRRGKTFQRRGGIVERRYLRGGAAAEREQALADLQEAVNEAVAESAR